MSKMNNYALEGMLTTYYLLTSITFSNGNQADIRVGIDQMDGDDIKLDDVVIIIDIESIPSHWPKGWVNEVKKTVVENITLKHTLAMRIKETQRVMDQRGIGKDDSINKAKDKQDSQSQFGKDELNEDGDDINWDAEASYEESTYADAAMDVHDAYEELLDPVEFSKNFTDVDDFKSWAREGTIEDIRSAIRAFEKSEMYEHCSIMVDIIKEKENEV